jgi:phosphate uptake regulator
LATNYHMKLKCKPYEKDLRKIEAAVEDTFSRVRKQFENFERTDAEKLLSEYLWVNQLCDQREGDLITQPDKPIPSANAVALALYIRHLKRINSHLRNISTCIVNPFDKIRFVPKSEKK